LFGCSRITRGIGFIARAKNHKLETKNTKKKRQLLSICEEDYGALLIKMLEASWLHDTEAFFFTSQVSGPILIEHKIDCLKKKVTFAKSWQDIGGPARGCDHSSEKMCNLFSPDLHAQCFLADN
jgi:hypothetical protein